MTLCKRKGQHQSHAIDNVFLSLRNRRLDKADKQEQRQAEISYRHAASAAWRKRPHSQLSIVHQGMPCAWWWKHCAGPLRQGCWLAHDPACCAWELLHTSGRSFNFQCTTAEWCGQTLQASQLCWACMAHAEGSLTVRRYSKEVQGVLMAIERFKRQHCQDSDELYYQRLRMMDLEEDWELRWLLHSPLSDELSGALFVPKASGTARS